MSKQIQEVKKQIEKLKVTNRDDGREVTLNGLNICRGTKSDEVKDIRYDRDQCEAKRAHMAKIVDEQLK